VTVTPFWGAIFGATRQTNGIQFANSGCLMSQTHMFSMYNFIQDLDSFALPPLSASNVLRHSKSPSSTVPFLECHKEATCQHE
jgi:hypothetical protein